MFSVTTSVTLDVCVVVCDSLSILSLSLSLSLSVGLMIVHKRLVWLAASLVQISKP